MRQIDILFRWGWTFLVVVTLGLAGCDGDDGAAGAAGAPGVAGGPGPAGPPGPGASITPLESCGVCHDDGSFASASAAHAKTSEPAEVDVGSFANFAVAPDTVTPADLIVSFSVTADGAPATDAVFGTLYVSDGTTRRSTSTREPVAERLSADFVNNGDGTYSVRLIDGQTLFGGTDSRYLVIVEVGANELEIAAVGDYPNPIPLAGLASSEACVGCHGPSGEGTGMVGRFNPLNRGGHYSAPMSADACVVCHRPDNPATPNEDEEPSYMQFFRVVHGIHNSHNFPDGEFASDRNETRPEDYPPYDVSYPTYMSNCSVCHSDDTIVPATGGSALAAANAMPVSGRGCFSCHGSMESASFDFTGFPFHLTGITDPETHDCQTACHTGNGIASTKVVVADFHNGLNPGGDSRRGPMYDGVDVSVDEGKKFDWKITDVAEVTDVDTGETNLEISWTAAYDSDGDGTPEPVDPCNDTVAAGAPGFHAAGGTWRIYRSYAQGEDFIIGQSTSAPGQAANVSVTVDNTECLMGIATTTITADDEDAERGRVAFGGKPQVVTVAGTVAARVPSPTFDWLVGVGGAAPERRSVVDTGECLTCHVGSLYQHGGDRVDNVDMCLVCHNSASNEKNVRVGMGVDESEAYDGKVGETFEMKTMLHRIHSAGVEGQPVYAIYRNRGIYAFAPDVSDVPNWDVVSTEGCTADEIAEGKRRVFGSDPASTNKCQVHNFHSADYPRALNACTACHTVDDPATMDVDEDFTVIPDQTKAMASTTDAGSTDWDDQIDDVLQGAATTACVTCHADGASKGHAYQNSWTPQAFPEGRQTIIDAVN